MIETETKTQTAITNFGWNPMFCLKLWQLKVGGKKGAFFFVVGAPYTVYTTKREVDYSFLGVDLEGVQLCLSGWVSRGRVYYQRGYSI